jgi:hypothetical protein
MERRARLLGPVAGGGFLAEVAGEPAPRVVARADIAQRVRLPWRPSDLRDYLIVFRRRDADRQLYVEDLRVRRRFVVGLLKLLSRPGTWRPHHGTEPMHLYYSGFEWLAEDALEEALPEDGVPEGLNFQDVDEEDAAAGGLREAGLDRELFVDWLREGRHDCEVAQALLRAWTANLAGRGNDSLEDLFDQLLAEARGKGESEEGAEDEERTGEEGTGGGSADKDSGHDARRDAGARREPRRTLPLAFLGRYAAQHCTLGFQVRGGTPAEVAVELAERVA